MNSLSISSNKLKLIISDRNLSDLKKTLHLGQTIRGRIVEVLPRDKMILKLGGFNVVAESEMAFNKGDILSAVVCDLDRKIILRLLLPPTEGALRGSPRDILRHLGIAADRLNLAIAEELQDLGFTLTKAGLKEIRDGFKAWETLLKSFFGRRQLIRAILFLSLRGVPITARSLDAIHYYLYGSPLLGEQLRKLERQLKGRLDEGKAKDGLKDFEKAFPAIEKKDLAGQLSRIVEALGLSYENEVSAGLLESLQIRFSLKYYLLLLEQSLRSAEGETFQEVLESVEDILGNIEGQQLASLPCPDETSGSFAHFQIPLRWRDEEGTAEVWVFRDREKRVDPENMKLALQIEMRHLGKVKARMELSYGTLTCKFTVGCEAIRSLFESNFSDLTENLEGLNYFVRKVGCVLTEDEEILDRFEGQIPGAGENRGYIDLMV